MAPQAAASGGLDDGAGRVCFVTHTSRSDIIQGILVRRVSPLLAAHHQPDGGLRAHPSTSPPLPSLHCPVCHCPVCLPLPSLPLPTATCALDSDSHVWPSSRLALDVPRAINWLRRVKTRPTRSLVAYYWQVG